MQAETCRCTTLQYVLDEWAKELAPSMDYVQANPDEFNARCGDSKLAVINAAFMAGRN
jgi:hypothetical protein